MKNSLKGKVLIILFSFVILLNIVSVFMNYRNFVKSSEQFNYSTASTVAETCRLIIDNDKLESYRETGRRDTEYYETWNKLIDYRNTNPKIVELSVVWFDATLCHYYFDTDLTENGAFLLDCKEYDSKQKDNLDDLVAGRNIDSIVYYDHIDVYRPLLSSYNIPIGYVLIGISTAEDKMEQYIYLCKLVGALALLSVVLTIVMGRYFTNIIINPINKLSEATKNYAEFANDKNYVSPLKDLSIHTGDEIERLFLSVQKMEEDLLSSSNNLSIAMWNSNHDSMTQLYNKRYLAEYISKYTEVIPIAAFYFDVDNLKKMNDICGHEQGDAIICMTASFVRTYSTDESPGFRVGGDEFLLLVNGKSEEEVKALYDKMQKDPNRQLTNEDSKVNCRISIGYAYAAECLDLDALIKEADTNMYADKQSHR